MLDQSHDVCFVQTAKFLHNVLSSGPITLARYNPQGIFYWRLGTGEEQHTQLMQ